MSSSYKFVVKLHRSCQCQTGVSRVIPKYLHSQLLNLYFITFASIPKPSHSGDPSGSHLRAADQIGQTQPTVTFLPIKFMWLKIYGELSPQDCGLMYSIPSRKGHGSTLDKSHLKGFTDRIIERREGTEVKHVYM